MARFSDFLGRGDDDASAARPSSAGTPNEPAPPAPNEPPPPPPPGGNEVLERLMRFATRPDTMMSPLAAPAFTGDRAFVETLPPVDDDLLPRRGE